MAVLGGAAVSYGRDGAPVAPTPRTPRIPHPTPLDGRRGSNMTACPLREREGERRRERERERERAGRRGCSMTSMPAAAYPCHPPLQNDERLVFCCRTTSASSAPCTSRRICCHMHCASYCAPCQPLLRAFSGWIRSPPLTSRMTNPYHFRAKRA